MFTDHVLIIWAHSEKQRACQHLAKLFVNSIIFINCRSERIDKPLREKKKKIECIYDVGFMEDKMDRAMKINWKVHRLLTIKNCSGVMPFLNPPPFSMQR